MSAQEVCPVCGEGHVTAMQQMVEYEYKGQKTELVSHYLQCDTCTSDFAGMAESKLNKRIVMAYRKKVDGLLTGAEIAALRKQYKLTQGQAAKLFGGGPVAFSKYENDDVLQSEAMDTLLRLVGRDSKIFWSLADLKGLNAEFIQQRTTLTTSKVVSIKTTRTQADRPGLNYYNPREFRQYNRGEVVCPQ